MSVAILTLFLAAAGGSPGSITAEPPAGEKLICERQIETGSRLRGKKVCKTKRQWAEEAAEARRAMRDSLTGGRQAK